MSRSLRRKLVHTVIVSAVLIAPPLVSESQGTENVISARDEVVKRSAAVDCYKIKAPQKSRRSFPRLTNSLVKVGTPVKLNDESAPDILTAGVWSPAGDAIAFVAPTGEYLKMNEAEAAKAESDPASAPTLAVARSVNAVWVYNFQGKKWNMAAEDGARPRFSKDGKRLLYLSSKGAKAMDLETMTELELGVPEAGDPHKRFHAEVMSDGAVLSTGPTDNLLKQRGNTVKSSAWAAIELAPNDEVRIAPDEKRIAVIYNATESTPSSALVVYDQDGKATPVLKNCPVPAVYATWSQDGGSLIYPLRATGQPEVWETRLSGGLPQMRVRLQPNEEINDVSLSPDGKYVAFSQVSHTGKAWIWIANEKGMQRIVPGTIAKWSSQGDRLLYAVQRAPGEFDWYVVPVTFVGN